ncbi:MAG: hypothetical protein QXJ84_06730 [Desulfurococcaceae archaeon]
MDFNELLRLIIVLALIDSIDPCIYAIFALIVVSATLVNLKYAVKAGTTFIASVYFGYVAFGMLLRYAFIRLPMQLLAVLLLIYGFTLLLYSALTRKKGYVGELVCREDDVPCKVASILRLDRLVYKGLPMISVLGLVSSFTLLPCSAGLFLAFNVILKNYEFWVWLPSTLFYVLVFVSPLILLLLALIYVSKLKAVYDILLKHEKFLKMIGSLIMVSTAIYILLTY